MSSWLDARTFSEVWVSTVEQFSSNKFLIFEGSDGSRSEWTYSSFDHLVGRVAYHLDELGVQKGSAIHLALRNSPGFVAIWIAAIRLGAWIVPSDPFGTAAELAEHVSRTSPSIGFYSNSRRETYLSLRPTMPVIEVDEDDHILDQFGSASFTKWPTVNIKDRAAVMFTSGTTGRPKGVVITQANYAFAGKTMSDAANLQSQHRQLVVLPMFHANAQYYSFASAIWAGASVALMHTFSASRFVQQASSFQATHASLFAAPIRMILSRGNFPNSELRLEHCWYAMNLSQDHFETFSQLLGFAPRQLYGMTETIPAVLTDTSTKPAPSSMGQVTSGCEVQIHDSLHRKVLPETVGEVVVRGDRGITIFAGYLDDEATTNASFSNDWFLTGDRAIQDAEGSFTFDGRRQDVLKVAGENVSIIEVEIVLSSHPKIFEAVVVGAPDPIRDEVPVAFVVAKDHNFPPLIHELRSWCEARLSKSKCPRAFVMMDELPRTSVGKIRKFVLKELAINHYTEEEFNLEQGAKK